MVRYISNRKAEIDIHNMHKEEARRHIEPVSYTHLDVYKRQKYW